MFEEAFSFNEDLSGWDVSKCQDMTYMFFKADSFSRSCTRNWSFRPNVKKNWKNNSESKGDNAFIGSDDDWI